MPIRRPSSTGRSPSRRHPINAGAGCLLLGTLGLLVACSRTQPEVVRYDLAHSLEAAQRDAERRAFDLGAPEARTALLEGWSWNERTPDGTSFVWSDGPRSAIEIFLLEPRPLTLVVRGFVHPELETHDVEIWSANRSLGRLELSADPAVRTLELPADAFPRGRGRLELRYHRTVEVAGRDPTRRRLAVGWDWIRLADRSELESPEWRADPEPVASRTASGRLVLAAGLQLAYPLELGPGSSLVLAGISTRGLEGSEEPTLRAWLDTGRELLALGEWQGHRLDARVPLGMDSFAPATLFLQAAPAPEGGHGRVVVTEATVVDDGAR